MNKPEPMTDHQCPSCGGFCKKSGCERANLSTGTSLDEPAAWEIWVGADTPLNAPMGWQRYGIYDKLIQAETTARTINSYKQAPFAKIVPLYRRKHAP